MDKRKWNDKQLIEIVKDSLSYADVLRKLGLKAAGSNYDTIKRKIKELNLDTSHMTGSAWNQGNRYSPVKLARPLVEILVENSTFINTNHLKEKILKEGIKNYECECCKRTLWMEKPIALELHHINGIKSDLRIENLQLLCPNCHSFTDNYRGKNIGMSAQKETFEVELCKFEETLTCNDDGNLEPSLINKEGVETIHKVPKSKKEVVPKYCEYCGKLLERIQRRNKYCSEECYRESSKGKRPPVLELIETFKNLTSFVQVGKYYGVTDNAVRKWCSFYGILDTVKK